MIDSDKLREAYLQRLTVDSPHHDARRRDFNQAVFLDTGQPIWSSVLLDMVMVAFDKAVNDLKRG